MGKIRFANGEWYITGYENSALVLLSSDGSKTATFNANITSNKYSESDLTPEKLLTKFGSNFTGAEKTLLNEVIVYTDENNDSANKVSAKGYLYLPNAASPSSHGSGYKEIYLGTDDSIKVFIGNGTKLSLNGGIGIFWLRSPHDVTSYFALAAHPGSYVRFDAVYLDDASVVPACNLNLSSVIFASVATAATSENSGESLTADTFTLRMADTSGATVTYSAEGVVTTGANGKYLMVQTTDNKIYTKSITSDNQTFTLNDIGVTALTENDRVWVESTTENVTYAKLGTCVKKTVTVEKEGNGTVTGGGKCIENSSATVNATADSGNTFVGWYKEDTKVSDDASYTFTVTEDVTLTAKFVRNYAVTVNNGTGDGNYAEGATVTIVVVKHFCNTCG